MKIKHRSRFLGVIIAIIALATVGIVAPQQLSVMVAKLSLLTLGGIAGFYMDRMIFPYANPGHLKDLAEEALKSGTKEVRELGKHLYTASTQAGLRRAIIVAAAILGIGLGL